MYVYIIIVITMAYLASVFIRCMLLMINRYPYDMLLMYVYRYSDRVDIEYGQRL